MKRVISLVLCVLMIFSLSATAFADKPSSKSEEETSALVSDGAFIFSISQYAILLQAAFDDVYPDLQTGEVSTIFTTMDGNKIYACAIADKNLKILCRIMAYDIDTAPTNGLKNETPIAWMSVSVPTDNTDYMAAILTAIPLACDVSLSVPDIGEMITKLLENLPTMAILANEEQEPNYYDRNGIRYELFYNSLNKTLFFKISVIQD